MSLEEESNTFSAVFLSLPPFEVSVYILMMIHFCKNIHLNHLHYYINYVNSNLKYSYIIFSENFNYSTVFTFQMKYFGKLCVTNAYLFSTDLNIFWQENNTATKRIFLHLIL